MTNKELEARVLAGADLLTKAFGDDIFFVTIAFPVSVLSDDMAHSGIVSGNISTEEKAAKVVHAFSHYYKEKGIGIGKKRK